MTDLPCCHAARRGRGLDCSRRLAAVSRLIAALSRFAEISAAAIRRQLFAKPASFDLPFSPARWPGRFGLASGFDARTPSLLADKNSF
ncbi:hypothetical protein [Caballeronia hypogeia]|uniref:hypothetical protein n=1 Tax=Caballeronia hypogeia TaxID=1777140 RepID=UPI000AB086A8|nr:hypothetical protein [Caballeronia hypogeia]